MLAFLSLLLVEAGAAAKPVVVELYTARGCAPCIPAERALRRMDGRPGVILLTFPVPYWDARTRDPDARPAFTVRQMRYAKVAKREVATPQFVVGGRFAFSDPGRLDGALAAGRSDLGPTIKARARTLRIGADPVMARPATVWLVTVRSTPDFGQTAGTRSAREPTRHHEPRVGLVTSIRAIGTWRGAAARLRLPPPRSALERVVLVQGDEGGAIVAAAKLP